MKTRAWIDYLDCIDILDELATIHECLKEVSYGQLISDESTFYLLPILIEQSVKELKQLRTLIETGGSL